jgi:hypothetical protein
MTVLFDKLGMSRKLEGEGKFTRLQAETLSDTLHDALNEGAATKADVEGVKTEMRLMGARLMTVIAETNLRTILWIAGLFVAAGIIQHFWK